MQELREDGDEQSRELIRRAENDAEKPVIQTEFINVLHRLLDEIELSQELIITDPYLLNGIPNSWYERFLKKLFTPLYAKVTTITFIVGNNASEPLFNNLTRHVRATRSERTNDCRFRLFINDTYHDRFWVCAANQKGIFVGNSLTGIGKKYCFVGRLPDEDAQAAFKTFKGIID